MKKMLLILLMLILCGCSNKLICNYETEYDGVKIKNKILFDFEKGTLEQIDKMIFEDSITAASYYSDIKDYKEEYNLNLDDNIIISKMTDVIKLDGDIDKIKKQYESYDYKCK